MQPSCLPLDPRCLCGITIKLQTYSWIREYTRRTCLFQYHFRLSPDKSPDKNPFKVSMAAAGYVYSEPLSVTLVCAEIKRLSLPLMVVLTKTIWSPFFPIYSQTVLTIIRQCNCLHYVNSPKELTDPHKIQLPSIAVHVWVVAEWLLVCFNHQRTSKGDWSKPQM